MSAQTKDASASGKDNGVAPEAAAHSNGAATAHAAQDTAMSDAQTGATDAAASPSYTGQLTGKHHKHPPPPTAQHP